MNAKIVPFELKMPFAGFDDPAKEAADAGSQSAADS
jgi:hypothetical protein